MLKDESIVWFFLMGQDMSPVWPEVGAFLFCKLLRSCKGLIPLPLCPVNPIRDIGDKAFTLNSERQGSANFSFSVTVEPWYIPWHLNRFTWLGNKFLPYFKAHYLFTELGLNVHVWAFLHATELAQGRIPAKWRHNEFGSKLWGISNSVLSQSFLNSQNP